LGEQIENVMNPIHMIIPEKEIKPSKYVGVSERFGWIIGGYFCLAHFEI